MVVDSDSEEYSSDLNKGGPKQRKISVQLWDGTEKEVMQHLPDDIDGKKVYHIKELTTDQKVVAALKDGRK